MRDRLTANCESLALLVTTQCFILYTTVESWTNEYNLVKSDIYQCQLTTQVKLWKHCGRLIMLVVWLRCSNAWPSFTVWIYCSILTTVPTPTAATTLISIRDSSVLLQWTVPGSRSCKLMSVYNLSARRSLFLFVSVGFLSSRRTTSP